MVSATAGWVGHSPTRSARIRPPSGSSIPPNTGDWEPVSPGWFRVLVELVEPPDDG